MPFISNYSNRIPSASISGVTIPEYKEEILGYKILYINPDTRTYKIERKLLDGSVIIEEVGEEVLDVYRNRFFIFNKIPKHDTKPLINVTDEKEIINVPPVYDRCVDDGIPYPEARKEWNKLQKSFKCRFLKLCAWIDSWVLRKEP